jgi:hypothetical protein
MIDAHREVRAHLLVHLASQAGAASWKPKQTTHAIRKL